MAVAAPGCRIHLCGRLRVEVGGEAREGALRGRQGRLLLAFLLLARPRPVRRDELVEALWPDARASPRDGALAPLLSRVRRVLDPGTVEGRDQLSLVLAQPAWIDAEVAAEGLERARVSLRQERFVEAMRTARQVTSLVGPGLLSGYEEPWLVEPRAALAELEVEAFELQAVAGLAAGSDGLPEAEAAARAAVSAAPFRESARRALIDVLRARGNVAEALLAFEDLRVLLREELGTTPGPAMLELHRELLAGEPAAPPAPTSAPPRRGAHPAQRSSPGRSLVEREPELADIDAALSRLAAGEGGVLLLEGPAGIGKTRLLDELRARASAGGSQVLHARAAILEREYGFGVVRQLLGAHAQDRNGPSGPALAALPAFIETGAPEGPKNVFAMLDGLVHMVKRLAERQPLVVSVDDLQWSDPPSLRFVTYLSRRVADPPILIAASVRTGEPEVDEVLLGELAREASGVVLRPAPLTLGAVAELVRRRLDGPGDGAFVAACRDVTAGNPLLVSQLLEALRSEAVRSNAEHASDVRAIGRRAVTQTVLLRLARMPEPAIGVARAVAVLGEGPAPYVVAGLVGVEEAEAVTALDGLARAEILRGEEPLGFVHPLVRDAVYGEMPATRRGLQHARAAEVLAQSGASIERVAAQLLRSPARGDQQVVERLREAARVAIARGGPDGAVAYLQRAQLEPPNPEQAARVALELGEVATYTRGPAAVEPLREAITTLTDPADRARAALMLSRLLYFLGDPAGGSELAARVRGSLPTDFDDLRQGLEAVELIGVRFGVLDPSALTRLETVRRGPRGSGPGARALTALAALALALGCGPADEAASLAREALAGDLPVGAGQGLFTAGAGMVLALADPAEGVTALRRIGASGARRGSMLEAVGDRLWGGLALLWSGDLAAARNSEVQAFEAERLWGLTHVAEMGYSAAFLAAAWLESGDPDRAAEALRRTDGSRGASDATRFWLLSQAELELARDRPREAIEVSERIEAITQPDTHPLWSPWRSLRARALTATGQHDRALELAHEELALARRTGAPWVIGRGLRILAALEGESGVGYAQEAVRLLDPTSARLERAKAYAALAGVLAAAGRRAEASEARSRALGLAEQCGAAGLAYHVRKPLI